MLARRLHPVLSHAARTLSSFLSSTASASADSTVIPAGDGGGGAGKDTLSRRLLSLIHDKRSAVVELTKWAEEGKKLQKYQLNRITRELRKFKRYKHALEICEWMTIQPSIKLLPGDYAVHLDLVAKVRGLNSAEKFYEDMPERMKGPSTCTALLHTYVQFNSQLKAETLIEEMIRNGFLTCPLPFNHMLTLYLSNGELEKMPNIVKELRKYIIPDVVTYNLLLTSCARKNDIKEAQKYYLELKNDKINPDWYTYSLLSNMYIKSGHENKARNYLNKMEKMASKKERPVYCSLISLYTNLLDKENVERIMNDMKTMFRKLSDAEYKCILSSLTKLGNINKAEELYTEWESVSGTRDSRVANIILSFYINNGMIIKAENFVNQIQEKGIRPSYSTYEILSKGYLKKKNARKVLECFKKGLSCLQKWEPNRELVREIFSLLEETKDVEAGEEFVGILRNVGFVGTEVYSMLCRVYEKAGKMPPVDEFVS
ncbi:hypothetical protein LUZ60_001343 [Juncus effusus]|nr:hypothetical protein LUZ60_001343 [Juncus effusus]